MSVSSASSWELPDSVRKAPMLRELVRSLIAAAGPEGLTTAEVCDAIQANSEINISYGRVQNWLKQDEDAGLISSSGGGAPWVARASLDEMIASLLEPSDSD